MPPKRTSTPAEVLPLSKNVWRQSLAHSAVVIYLDETTNARAAGLAAPMTSRPTLATTQGPPAMACDYLLYVSAHVSPHDKEQAEAPQSVFAHWRSAEAWYRDDPSDPRRPCGPPRFGLGRPDQSSTRRCRRLTSVSCDCPPGPVC